MNLGLAELAQTFVTPATPAETLREFRDASCPERLSRYKGDQPR